MSNKIYLAWLRELPCCICMDDHSEPHHIKGLKLGKNMKIDELTIPLCRAHHDAFHQDPAKWEKLYGPQTKYLADTLVKAIYQGWILDENL